MAPYLFSRQQNVSPTRQSTDPNPPWLTTKQSDTTAKKQPDLKESGRVNARTHTNGYRFLCSCIITINQSTLTATIGTGIRQSSTSRHSRHWQCSLLYSAPSESFGNISSIFKWLGTAICTIFSVNLARPTKTAWDNTMPAASTQTKLKVLSLFALVQ